MENPDQILAREGVDGGLAPDRRIHHRYQSGWYLDDRDPPHVGRGDEAGQIADHPAAKSDHSRVPTIALGEHLVGEAAPGLAGLVGFARLNSEDIDSAGLELALDLSSIQRLDVRVGDDRVPVRRCNLAHDVSDSGQIALGDRDRVRAEPDLMGRGGLWCLGGARLAAAYQVTSPAPVRTFATRASMKRRSESLLR